MARAVDDSTMNIILCIIIFIIITTTTTTTITIITVFVGKFESKWNQKLICVVTWWRQYVDFDANQLSTSSPWSSLFDVGMSAWVEFNAPPDTI